MRGSYCNITEELTEELKSKQLRVLKEAEKDIKRRATHLLLNEEGLLNEQGPQSEKYQLVTQIDQTQLDSLRISKGNITSPYLSKPMLVSNIQRNTIMKAFENQKNSLNVMNGSVPTKNFDIKILTAVKNKDRNISSGFFTSRDAELDISSPYYSQRRTPNRHRYNISQYTLTPIKDKFKACKKSISKIPISIRQSPQGIRNKNN